VQEYCNALFDALFHILPLATEMDKVEATPVRAPETWEPEALEALEHHLDREPFLLRISAAKRWRERMEREARAAGEPRVTAERVRLSLAEGVPA